MGCTIDRQSKGDDDISEHLGWYAKVGCGPHIHCAHGSFPVKVDGASIPPPRGGISSGDGLHY